MTNEYMNDEAELPNIGYKQNKNNMSCLQSVLFIIILPYFFSSCCTNDGAHSILCLFS